MAEIDRRSRSAAGSREQATFIVRLRREQGTPAGEWRGEVEHVQSALKARFVDQAALSAFVWSQLVATEQDDADEGQRPARDPGSKDVLVDPRMTGEGEPERPHVFPASGR